MLTDFSTESFSLYKFVGLSALPLTWIWGLLLLTIILLAIPSSPRRIRLARSIASAAFLLIWSLGAGPLSSYLVGILEQAYPPFDEHRIVKRHEAIVVLAGGVLAGSGARPSPELPPVTFQNVLCGARAYAQNISPKLIFSGDEEETMTMATLAHQLGVPNQAIVLEHASLTTLDNATHVSHLVQPSAHLVLVTSALHMPRAVRTFERKNLHITPYPCGYLTSLKLWAWPEHLALNDFMPKIENLERSTKALHEMIGLGVYELLGKKS
jgi:uncharacterized SAM-binding protein YcdF (DUF218 family)